MFIKDSLRDSVFFLTHEDQVPRGSGFFIAIENRQLDACQYYAVTAAHCLAPHGGGVFDSDPIFIRLNTKDGKTRAIETRPSNWHFHDSLDIALIEFEYEDWMQFMAVGENLIIPPDDVGLGDDIFILGLFRHHAGTSKNIPVARIGNVVAMPEEPIQTPSHMLLSEIDAYLVECRSTLGLSGSPVFHYASMYRRRKDEVTGVNLQQIDIRLLGVVHGHFKLGRHNNLDIAIDATEQVSRIEELNLGIACVCPSTGIHDLLNRTDVAARRERLFRQFAMDRGIEVVADGSEDGPSDPKSTRMVD